MKPLVGQKQPELRETPKRGGTWCQTRSNTRGGEDLRGGIGRTAFGVAPHRGAVCLYSGFWTLRVLRNPAWRGGRRGQPALHSAAPQGMLWPSDRSKENPCCRRPQWGSGFLRGRRPAGGTGL